MYGILGGVVIQVRLPFHITRLPQGLCQAGLLAFRLNQQAALARGAHTPASHVLVGLHVSVFEH